MSAVLVGTESGLYDLVADAEPVFVGRAVRALTGDGERWWVALDGGDLVVGEPGREWVTAVSEPGVRVRCLLATADEVLAGTAGAHLVRVTAGRLKAVPSFESMRGREAWYTPWGGPPDTRSISAADGALYVNVHVGGIARSRDGGATWQPTLDIDLDVHQVVAVGRGVVLAATGAAGLAVSRDGGESWDLDDAGLHGSYCRAVALAGDSLLLSASTGPRTQRSGLYRRSLQADTPFERCVAGLPDWFEANIDTHCLDARGDMAAFGTGDGRVYTSGDAGRSWTLAAAGLAPVTCVSLDG